MSGAQECFRLFAIFDNIVWPCWCLVKISRPFTFWKTHVGEPASTFKHPPPQKAMSPNQFDTHQFNPNGAAMSYSVVVAEEFRWWWWMMVVNLLKKERKMPIFSTAMSGARQWFGRIAPALTSDFWLCDVWGMTTARAHWEFWRQKAKTRNLWVSLHKCGRNFKSPACPPLDDSESCFFCFLYSLFCLVSSKSQNSHNYQNPTNSSNSCSSLVSHVEPHPGPTTSVIVKKVL